MRFTQLVYIVSAEQFMHFACARPGDDADIGLGGDILGEILVRHENDRVGLPFLRDCLDHLRGVRTGAGDVALGLHVRGCVHIGDDRIVGILFLDKANIGAGDRSGE